MKPSSFPRSPLVSTCRLTHWPSDCLATASAPLTTAYRWLSLAPSLKRTSPSARSRTATSSASTPHWPPVNSAPSPELRTSSSLDAASMSRLLSRRCGCRIYYDLIILRGEAYDHDQTAGLHPEHRRRVPVHLVLPPGRLRPGDGQGLRGGRVPRGQERHRADPHEQPHVRGRPSPGVPRSEERRVGKECRSRWETSE